MAIRDHFRLDLLVSKAAEQQAVDAELGEVERLVADAQNGVGGQCRACGAPHSRGAALLLALRPAADAPGPVDTVGAAVVPPPPAPLATTAANGNAPTGRPITAWRL